MKNDTVKMKQNSCLISVLPDQVKFWESQGFVVLEPPTPEPSVTTPKEK